MSQTTSHIEFEKITDFVQGTISEHEKAEIAAHLAACPVCGMQKKRLEQTLETMFADKLEDVPTYLSERVFDMFDLSLAQNQTEKTPFREKILAAFQFDKLIPAPGLRSSQEFGIRSVQFIAKKYLINIQVIPVETGDLEIKGKILGESVGGNAELEGETETRIAEINDYSEFSFDGLKAGKYNLCIKIEDTEINFPDIFI